MVHAIRLPHLVLLASTALLGACGGTDAPASAEATRSADASTAPATVAAAAQDGALAAFIGDRRCEVLSPAVLQSMFGAPADIQIEPGRGRIVSSCTYSWARPDADARRDAAMADIAATAPRDAGKATMKAITAGANDRFRITVSLQTTQAKPEWFVPAKLSADALEQRVAEANRAADARLSDTQRETLAKAGIRNTMAGDMVRQANERVEVPGVGDAAYWVPVMGGALNVLAGDVQVSISLNLADDQAGNIDAAQRVFAALGR